MNSDKTNTDKYFLLNISYKKQDNLIVDSAESPINKANTEYFEQLIRTALADNFISASELELLHSISQRLGFTIDETDRIINKTGNTNCNPSASLFHIFEQVFEIVNMTLADASIDKNKMHLVSDFAAKCGFNDEEIPEMVNLLSNGIRQGKSKAELFKDYQNKVK